jgi:hypothetical protein
MKSLKYKKPAQFLVVLHADLSYHMQRDNPRKEFKSLREATMWVTMVVRTADKKRRPWSSVMVLDRADCEVVLNVPVRHWTEFFKQRP